MTTEQEKDIFDCFLKIRAKAGNRPSDVIHDMSSKELKREFRDTYGKQYSHKLIRSVREKLRNKYPGSLSDYLNMVNIGSMPYPYDESK